MVPVWPIFALGWAACSDHGGASSLHLCMFGASRSGDPDSPKPFHGNSGSSVSSLRHAMFSALGFNASGSAVAAFSSTPMSLTLVVPLVEAGAAYVPCSCKDHITAPLAAAQAIWQHTSQLDAPRHCPLQLHTLHRCVPHSCTHHIAVRLTAAHTTLLCASQLHTPCRCAPRSCTGHLTVPLAAAWPRRGLSRSPKQVPGFHKNLVLYMYLAQYDGYSHYPAQDAGYQGYLPPQP
jgi:hypothetical protein